MKQNNLKNISLLIIAFSLVIKSYSQSVYDLNSGGRTVKKEKLKGVKTLNDLISNYPSNWITSYQSVELKTVVNGIPRLFTSSNNILTKEQQNALIEADVLSYIVVKVNYVYKNTLSQKLENHTMDVSIYVSPDTHAKFEGGEMQLREHLKYSILGSSSDTIPRRLGMVVVRFTVEEDGSINNAKVTKSCGDLFTDMRLVQAISKLPKWKPAEYKGVKIKQELQFTFGGC